jgi:hypothetical protein
VLGIVLPRVVARSIATAVGNIVLPIGVIHERVVVINVYRVVAAPSTVATPSAATPGSSNGHSNSKRDRHASRVVARRRISDGRVGIRRRAVDYRGIVTGNVNDVGLGLFDHDDAFVFDGLCLNLHLFVGLQIARIFCFHTHTLHGVHYVGLLC